MSQATNDLAEDHLVALFEVQALLGSPHGTWVPNPYQAWIILNVHVILHGKALATLVSARLLCREAHLITAATGRHGA